MKVSLSSIILVAPSLGVVAFVMPSHRRLVITRHHNNNNNVNNNNNNRLSQSSWSSLSSSSSLASSSSSSSFDEICDVLVLGSGPTGRAISTLLERKQLQVCLADANYDRPLVPNYGVWEDEWDAVVTRYAAEGVALTGGTYGRALNREWSQTDCFFGGSYGKPMTERTVIDRPYCQVDKDALKNSLSSSNDATTTTTSSSSSSSSSGIKVLRANHQSHATSINLYSPTGSLVHDDEGTTTVLQQLDGTTITVRSKLVVDATGHESKLVLRDARAPANAPPGFQIAYGCLVQINEANPETAITIGPYDKEAMTLFDYRTDHLAFDPKWEQRAIEEPTFMYVMPLEGNRVFFEETSLVARPGVSFQECKDRCFQRLKYLGIDVAKIEEEEFCYIPMGGSLPLKDQRIIALGGSAAMVHPSTGYHLCRMLMGAADVANSIARDLKQQSQQDDTIMPPNYLDKAAASAYHSIWNPETIRQRNFAVFGGEFLMKQTVVGLRGFFNGFFQLPLELWAGFLAGWPGLPNNNRHESWQARIWFGINFLTRLPAQVALEMIAAIVGYSLAEGAPLPQSVTPFLGAPPSYEYKDFAMETVGDPKAKAEAKRLIMTSKITELVPPAFDEAVVELVVDDDKSVGTEATREVSNVSVSQVQQEEEQSQQQRVPSTASDVVGEDSIATATTASAVDEESVVVTASSQQFPDDAFE